MVNVGMHQVTSQGLVASLLWGAWLCLLNSRATTKASASWAVWSYHPWVSQDLRAEEVVGRLAESRKLNPVCYLLTTAFFLSH